MGQLTVITIEDCFNAGLVALLRGDLEQKEILFAMAEATFVAHGQKMLSGNTPITNIIHR